MSADKDYFEDLLEQFDDPEKIEEISEEEKRQKNKDAEEARKRREAEAKAKEEAEAKAKAEEEARLKKEQEEKPKDEPAPKAEDPVKKKAEQTNRLGEQLVVFKEKYPDVDLSTLDKDTNFKKFINGKLLGKQNFTELYEDFIDLTSSLSGKNQEEVKKNHALKSKASSGTSKPIGKADPIAEIYSQEELEKISQKMPLMNDAEIRKVFDKFNKSVDYYKKNK